jgi:hypothetical protein
VGEDLEVAVVRGGHGRAAHLQQALQDGLGQRRALRRVGAGGQLVQQHQAVALHSAQDVDDVPHVRAEGRKGLLDALLVADIGVDGGEDG